MTFAAPTNAVVTTTILVCLDYVNIFFPRWQSGFLYLRKGMNALISVKGFATVLNFTLI